MAGAVNDELGRMRESLSVPGREVGLLSNAIGRGLRSAFDGLVFDGMKLSDALRGVADAMRGTGIFEPLALNLMRVGEETGRIGPMMLELAQILNREVENGIKRALTMLEPLLILVLGVLIAAIIVSILLGILSVNDLAV